MRTTIASVWTGTKLYLKFFIALFILTTYTIDVSAQCYGEQIARVPSLVRYNGCDILSLQDTASMHLGVDYTYDDNQNSHITVYEYQVPLMQGKLILKAKGGQGGNSRINCSGYELYGDGGKGGYVYGEVTVGTLPGDIPPGSIIRFVIGEAGQDSYSTSTGDLISRGGSGGGATGILFRGPKDTLFQVLMIAGGGGGGQCRCDPHELFITSNGHDGGLVYDLSQLGAPLSFVNTDLGGGGGAILLHTAGGGGGYYGDGEGAEQCGPCSGGRAGFVWTKLALPLDVRADISDCHNYTDERLGGRGFGGGGAAYNTASTSGGGGGGGATGGYASDQYDHATGGSSYANTQYVNSIVLQSDNSVANGYADLSFMPIRARYQPSLSISIGEDLPLCAGTPVTAVAKIVSPYGVLVDGVVPGTGPFFTWRLNGQVIGNGTTYNTSPFLPVTSGTYNTIPVVYNPGDTLICFINGIDTLECGAPVTGSGIYIIPQPDSLSASSLVQITSSNGDLLCSTSSGSTLYGLTQFDATANFADSVHANAYLNGASGIFYHNPTASAQEIALAACESVYGVGNCTVGTRSYKCNVAYPDYTSFVAATKAATTAYRDSVRYFSYLDNKYHLRVEYDSLLYVDPEVFGASIVSNNTTNCGTISFYYHDDGSGGNPSVNSYQFVFAASNMDYVNQDFSNIPLSYVTEGYEYYWNNSLGLPLSGPSDSTTLYINNFADTVNSYSWLQPSLYGESIAGKFPFTRRFTQDGRMVIMQPNLGSTPVPPNSNPDYKPSYKWYINGERPSLHQNVNDSTSSVQMLVADGDSVWCEVTSNHCAMPSISNKINMRVARTSTGGAIFGPLHPCSGTTVSYHIRGANNAVSYNWIIDGDVTNISGDDTTRTFTVGSENVNIRCIPQGPCGGGDTASFQVSPSYHILGTCYTSPIVVTPSVYCQGQEVTLSILGDTLPDHNNFDCYEWSTGATTRSITVSQDGTYYVYLNGCRQEVTIAGIAIPQPSIGISIVSSTIDNVRNYWCRQDGHRYVRVTSSQNLSAFSDVEYQWFKNGERIGSSSVSDIVDMNLANPYYSSHDTIICQVICTSSCGVVTEWSNSVVLPMIYDPFVPSISVSTPKSTLCAGETLSFTSSSVNGGDNPSFGWFVDGQLVASGPQMNYTFSNNSGNTETHYVYCNMVINTSGVLCLSGGPVARSQQLNITVNPLRTWYLDADGDGHYVNSMTACESPGSGYTTTATQSGDCDDNDSTKWQSALVYIDEDGDGYTAGSTTICYGSTIPAGYSLSSLGDDCNDHNDSAHTVQTWYLDADNDGHYIYSVASCSRPGPAYNTTATSIGDCDDNDPAKWQSAMLYVDADGDGYTVGAATSVCYGATIPVGYSATSLGNDCNDSNASVHAMQTWYLDADNDGHYISSQSSCGSPGAGYNTTATQSGDCNDNDATKWQSTMLYVDADGDGYTVGNPTLICYGASIPRGYSQTSLGSDCNDNDATKWRSALLYVDADGDGYTFGSPVMICYGTTVPAGYRLTSLGTDCNDSNAAIHPGATEIADGLDNNCNGIIDEGFTTLSINDVAMNEGNKGKSNMTFTVTLNRPTTKKVTVQYATQNGTATAASDYSSATGTLTFKAGTTKQTLNISIIGDKAIEPNETFKVNLSNATNATIIRASGTGTIINDDGVALAAVAGNESNTERSVKVLPNPASSILNIELSGYGGNITIQLADVLGKQLKQEKLQAGNMKYIEQQMNVSKIASGTYLLTIIDENGNRQTERVIIAR